MPISPSASSIPCRWTAPEMMASADLFGEMTGHWEGIVKPSLLHMPCGSVHDHIVNSLHDCRLQRHRCALRRLCHIRFILIGRPNLSSS